MTAFTIAILQPLRIVLIALAFTALIFAVLIVFGQPF
jgi:hypothetical protein